MKNQNTLVPLRVHGMYRIPATGATQEAKGQRAVPGQSGKTFVRVWKNHELKVFAIADTDPPHQGTFVSEIPSEAELVKNNFNHDGTIPSGVCGTLQLMLKIQSIHLLQKNLRGKKICTCEGCTFM